MDITSAATAIATIIGALAAGLAVWVKSLNERNNQRIKALEELTEWYDLELKKMRTTASTISESYQIITSRVEILELENTELKKKIIHLETENTELKHREQQTEKTNTKLRTRIRDLEEAFNKKNITPPKKRATPKPKKK